MSTQTIDERFQKLLDETNEKFAALKSKINFSAPSSSKGTRLMSKEEVMALENKRKMQEMSAKNEEK